MCIPTLFTHLDNLYEGLERERERERINVTRPNVNHRTIARDIVDDHFRNVSHAIINANLFIRACQRKLEATTLFLLLCTKFRDGERLKSGRPPKKAERPALRQTWCAPIQFI